MRRPIFFLASLPLLACGRPFSRRRGDGRLHREHGAKEINTERIAGQRGGCVMSRIV